MLKSVTVLDIVNQFIAPLNAATALEMGTGTGGILASLAIPAKLGVDAHTPSLCTAAENHPNIIVMKYDILKLMDLFLPKGFDVVVIFDVLEHFKQEDVNKVIEMAELLATKAVIIWGPYEAKLSPNPLPEQPMQEHLSYLTPEMFDARDYEILRFPRYWRIPRQDINTEGLLCFKKMK